MRRALLLLPLLLLSQSSATTGDTASVKLETVKYADLCKAVRAHAGKVIVVDIWASWCGPCKAEMPHLIELHRKYAARGLVCITVSVDKPETEKAALGYLSRARATFPNYRLAEDVSFWPAKLGLKSIPAVFVFNRGGRRAAKLTGDDAEGFTYGRDVEPLVRRLLEEKASGG